MTVLRAAAQTKYSKRFRTAFGPHRFRAEAPRRINVMAYRAGEALSWHFDRPEFTTTCLLQAPVAGGAFQYRSALTTESDPNYEGVARLLAGEDDGVRTLAFAPGTPNVFKGRNTAHLVTPSKGTGRASSLSSPTTRRRTSLSATRSASDSTAGPQAEALPIPVTDQWPRDKPLELRLRTTRESIPTPGTSIVQRRIP